MDDQKMAANLYVNLKEHFEMLLNERTERIKAQFEANAAKLEEMAKVLEHRLEVLNHAHEQSIQDRADFVRANEYSSMCKELSVWRATVNKQLTIISTRSVTWTAAIGVFFVVLQIVLKFWK